jgi:hypothetical protein
MVDIITIDKIGEDERGATHYFNTDRTGQFIVAYRKTGSISGRHYHKGIAPTKNPEQLILMQGEATVNWFDTRTSIEGSLKVKAPARIHIQPWAWHEVIADTDIIILELNGLEDAKDDTFRIEK